MHRRHLLAAGAAGAGLALAMPAIAQQRPRLRWRLTTGLSRSLDISHGCAEVFARKLSEITAGEFQIDVHPVGEISSLADAPDKVARGEIEACHVAAFWYVAKDPTYALACSVPFGPNQRLMAAWFQAGGGEEALNGFFHTQGFHAIGCGHTGAQMGGWFTKEINTPADFNGVKMRIGGFAGATLKKLGLQAVNVAIPELAAALKDGRLDAAEWIGPYDDEKLKLNAAAPYYYYPSFWEGNTAFHLFVNLDRWKALPPSYQAAIEAACAFASVDMMAKYDRHNPAALKRMVDAGTQLRPFSREVLEAAHKAARESYAEISATNATFRKIHESMSAFTGDGYSWFQIAEYNFDSYQIRARAGA